jgi:ParB family chromosome partitioning protein
MDMLMLKKEKNEVINRVVMLNVQDIHPNPLQPRRNFDIESLEELRQSIAANGLLQPITVRKVESGYELISGERRLRACKQNHNERVPAIIVNISDDQSGMLALVENIQRRDLNFLEEAAAIKQLMRQFGLSQTEVSQKIGKSQPCVANKLRLLQLPESVQSRVLENHLTERQARALLRLSKKEEMEKAVEVIVKRKLNSEATDAYIESLLTLKKKQNIKFCLKDIRVFHHTLEKALKLMQQSGIQAVSECKETEAGYDYWIHIPAKKA